MEYIIHLTDSCNLNCSYCYEKKRNKDIDFENIKYLIDNEINKKSKDTIIYFYGGEPLLKKDVIKDTIDYINSKKSKTKFLYGITTNGVLLDDEFLDYMKKNNFINIAYSIDGIKEAHDINRVNLNKEGSFDIVQENAKKVLKVYKDAVAMIVITKNNLIYLDKSINFLIDLGFKNINLMFDYEYKWQDEDLSLIKEMFYKVSKIYEEKLLQECDIEIPLLDRKIKSYVDNSYNCNDECELGIKNVEVGADGNFYPCVRFINNSDFIIGNCKDGLDLNAREKLIKSSKKEDKICMECKIRKRCKHTCACKNYLLTNDINGLSPLTCEVERILVEVADKMAENLYKENSKLFIQKYYNKDYNIIRQLISKFEK